MHVRRDRNAPRPKSAYLLTCLAVAGCALTVDSSPVEAGPITFNSTSVVGASLGFLSPSVTQEWLLVGTAPGSFGTTVSVNSGFELGAHLPLDGLVPTDGSPDIGGVTKPAGAVDPIIGIGREGDTALTDPTGKFQFQSIDGTSKLGATTGRSGIYGDTGVQCSQATGACNAGTSNSYFNSGTPFPMPNTPLAVGNGIVGGNSTSLLGLRNALTAANTGIPGLSSGGTLAGGSFSGDLTINLLNPGVHILDVSPAGGDWDLGNYDIVVTGPANALLIVRLPNNVNMKTSNSWIGIGGGGIGLNNVLFYTDQNNNNGHFNFNNTVFNGVSFWDLSGTGADLDVNNGQGCVQFIADQITLDDVRFNNCGFGGGGSTSIASVPEPTSLLLFGTGAAALAVKARRRQRQREV